MTLQTGGHVLGEALSEINPLRATYAVQENGTTVFRALVNGQRLTDGVAQYYLQQGQVVGQSFDTVRSNRPAAYATQENGITVFRHYRSAVRCLKARRDTPATGTSVGVSAGAQAMKILEAFRRAGLSEEQAGDVIAAIDEAVGENVTTQTDLHALELCFSKQLWTTVVGIVTANTVVMFGLLKLLHPPE